MASISQQGENWNVVYSFKNSRQWRRSCGKDKNKAILQKQIVEVTIAQLHRGDLVIPKDCDDVGTFIWTGGRVTRPAETGLPATLGEVLDKYLECSHVKNLSSNTQALVRIHAGHLKRGLGANKTLAGLKLRDVQKYIDKRRSDDGIVGGTAKAEITTLTTMWNRYALPEEIVDRKWDSAFPQKLNYGKMSEKPPFQTYQQITEQGGGDLWKSLYLQMNEVHELLSILERRHRDPAFNSVHSWVYPAVATALYTSFRRSSIYRMRVTDLDIPGERISERNKKIDHGKNETLRSVYLLPKLRPILARWLREHPGGEFLFCNRAGQQLTEKKTLNGLKLYLRDCEWSVIRGWHTFRHTFTTNAKLSGMPVDIIREYTGHQSEETERRYVHLPPSFIAEHAAKMYQ